jgi:TonB-linked SusC/RagA family outer membrane protein
MSAMLVVLATSVGYAQRTVSGKVTSGEDGSPLPGVSVVVKGTSTGTTTDVEGSYKIAAPDNSTLVFSYVGFVTQEVQVGPRSVVDVTLASDEKLLSEVVVTALGIEKDKKGLGVSLKEVSNSELTIARTTNVVNALSGKIAGVRVAGNNGMVGSSSAIFIRGFTTFTGSNQPLFVVDGVPINNDGGSNASQTGVSNSNRGIDINQDDIETMTVLKGPAAAVLYGSRAASGAIIITTKRGKIGKQKNTLTYTGSYNINEVNRFPDYQNEFAQGTSLNALGQPGPAVFQPNQDQLNWGPPIDGRLVPSAYSAADRALFGLPDQVPLTAYPNNVRNLFRQGQNIQNNLAFTGGNEKSSLYVSYNNLQDIGYMEQNQLNRHSFRINANSQLTNKLSVGINANYVYSASSRSQIGNQLSNPLFRGWFLPRNYNLQGDPWVRPDGSQVYFGAATDNPWWTLNNNLYNDRVNRIFGDVNLSYDVTDWLNINYKLGSDVFTDLRKTVDGVGARGQANHAVGGVGAIGDRSIMNQQINSFFNIQMKKNLTDDLKATLLVGNEIFTLYRRDQGVVGNTLASRGFNNILNASNFVPFGDEFRQRLIGVYADMQLSYRDWAFLNLTGRNDWSSTFRSGSNSYFYPSANLSVILSEAIPSLKSDWVNQIKLKGNYARVGRQAPIFSTDTYFFNANPSDGFGPNIQFPFLGQQGRTLGDAAGNAALGPEFTTQIEFGTELRFIKNRLGFEATYFRTESENIILNVPIAGASGFTSQTLNSGRMESSGIELSLDYSAIKTEKFTWNISANWTRIRNNVLELAPGVQNISLGPFTTAEGRIEAGQPYGVIYANTLLRNEAGRLIVNNAGLPIINTSGVQRVGDPNPKWTAGITNNLTYKGFNLNFLIDIRHGGDFLSRVVGDLRRTGSVTETTEFPRFNADGTPTTPYVIDGVRQSDGSPNTTPISAQQYWGSLYAFNVPGMFIFDASWLRLRELSLSYRLPKSWLDKTPFGQAELGINGRNLFLRTPVPHIDPESSVGTNNGNTQGIEFNALPGLRTYGVFLKFTL